MATRAASPPSCPPRQTVMGPESLQQLFTADDTEPVTDIAVIPTGYLMGGITFVVYLNAIIKNRGEIDSDKILSLPRQHKAKICMWKYLDVHSMDLFEKAQTTEELKSLLSELFSLQNSQSDPRSAILLDLYFYSIQFCRKQGFNREQTSAFFSIVKDTHEACVETPLPNVEECYNYFTELVFCHSIRRPPFSIDLFNQDQLVLMTDYVINTYFRHFKLYKYAFTPQVRLDISFSYIGMPEPKEEAPEPDESPELPLTTPLQEESEEAATAVEEDPMAALREYISTQLNQELAQLRLSVEQHLRATEEQFNSKLVQLEKGSSSSKAGSKGKKK